MWNSPAPDFVAEQVGELELNCFVPVLAFPLENNTGIPVQGEKAPISFKLLRPDIRVFTGRQAGIDADKVAKIGKFEL
jgi:hypothetical protein